MKKVVITADSAADIPREIAEKYGIKIMPMCVIFGGRALRDGVDITATQIFDYVEETGEIPKTSAVSPGEYIDFFTPFLEEGKAVSSGNLTRGEASEMFYKIDRLLGE